MPFQPASSNPFRVPDLASQALAFLKQELPTYVLTVDIAREEDKELLFSLETFPGDPEVLFLSLWYAYEQGVTVRLLPKKTRRKRSQTKK